MGGGESSGQTSPENSKTGSPALSAQAHPAPTVAALKPKARTGADVLSPENAAKLTIKERSELLKKAALLADPEKQADIVCGLLSAMTQEELEEATTTLLDAQGRGNHSSQAVWNTLWTQWGRVNAEACLALSKSGQSHPGGNGSNGLNTPDDYRCLMVGWLEVHPDEAMAWARLPKDDLREATAAAFAITSSAKGDLKQMETAILSISGNELTTKACLRDYFDLATSSGDKPPASLVYERLNPKLQAAAWTEVMERLVNGNGDLDAVTSWFEKHGNDPGCDFSATA